MDFFSRKGKQKEEAKQSDSSPQLDESKPIWNQDATLLPKDSQQAMNSILSALTKEKSYSEEVISRALSEYIKGLEGQTENDKLASLVSSSNRTVNVRRMCIKALLIESFQNSDLDSMARVERWSHAIFAKLEIRDNESLNKHASKYLQKLCTAIAGVVAEGEFEDEDLIIALSKKEYFPPLYWSISELNRQPLGTLPSEGELISQLKRGAGAVRSIRGKAIDLNDILSILISGPHQFTGVIPVLMQPLLSESKNPEESNKQLQATLERISKMIVWNDKTMPGTIANLQKHPGIPLASEVAKCLPFKELYKVFVNVAVKLLFAKGRGFDKCDIKLNYRLGNLTFGELRRLSFSAASVVTDIMAGMDMDDPAQRKGKSPMDGYKSNEEPLCVRDFRRLFDLSPEAYDKEGKPATQFSEKNRAHSFVASILLVPFLKGLYEARAKFLEIELSVDAPFNAQIEELEEKRNETRSLDEKRVLKKTIASVRRLHSRIVNVVQECQGENETKMKLELDLALSTASQLSLDPSELKKLAIKDVAKLNRNRDKKPGDARKLVEMAKDAPEWAKNVPPSPWTNFFSETLPSIEEKLRDPGAVHSHMDEFSGLLSEQLSSMIASAISVNEENQDVLAHDQDFKAVMRTIIEIALAKQKMKVNSKIVDLLRDVFFYVQAYPKTKTPDMICLKVIQISRPLIRTLMEFLHSVNGDDLFKALNEMIQQNKSQQ